LFKGKFNGTNVDKNNSFAQRKFNGTNVEKNNSFLLKGKFNGTNVEKKPYIYSKLLLFLY
jgi:hypothetical protein